ncbi:MAG: hypothetical protein Q7J69_06020 [Candidatus Omnitrophota bacterium]|nr:hypothetical protein [Candidatus Omnitrophota bacterium]
MSRTCFRLTGLFLPGLLLFSAPGNLHALIQDQESSWPNERERGSYQAKIASTGKLLWQVSWETKVTKEQGRSHVEINEQGEGTPWRAKEALVWKKKFLFQEGPLEPDLQVQSVVGSRWTQDGQPVSEMDFEVDPLRKQISYRDSEPGKKPQSAVFPWTSESIPDELLFHWVRTLPFQEIGDENPPASEFTLVVSPKRRFRIKVQIQGIEMVTTPAGTFSCYRISLVPQLPGPLKAMAPRMALWCRTDPPNYWVRYQGPVGGPGSPEAVIELMEFKQG